MYHSCSTQCCHKNLLQMESTQESFNCLWYFASKWQNHHCSVYLSLTVCLSWGLTNFTKYRWMTMKLSHGYVHGSHLSWTVTFFFSIFLSVFFLLFYFNQKKGPFEPLRLVWFSSATPKSSLLLGAACVCACVCVCVCVRVCLRFSIFCPFFFFLY